MTECVLLDISNKFGLFNYFDVENETTVFLARIAEIRSLVIVAKGP